jgi:NADH-quinone oxidoreductase subunit G
VEEIGAVYRGENMQITSYLEKAVTSELSGNVVDLCPVGALTHRPWAFNARPWELRKTDSIDVMDAMGASISVQARGREVMRILPRNHDDINEEWISDKARHVADGLRAQRLDRPYVRRNGRLEPATWDEALGTIAARLKAANPARVGAISGDLAGAEEMFALKALLVRMGASAFDCRQDGAKLDPANGRSGYLFNASIAGVESADAVLLVGTDPRVEAPVLNARLRKRWRQGTTIGLVGRPAELTYGYDHIGAGAAALVDVAEGRHAFSGVLRQAKRPLVIVGAGAVARRDGATVLAHAARIARDAGAGKEMPAAAFNVLHSAASRVAGLDLGFVTRGGVDAVVEGGMEVVWLLGADEVDMKRLGSAFVIYQGSHGDAGAHRADVVLPGSAYTEKSATYVNIEGRAQQTTKAAFAPGEAKEDWAIIRALSALVGHTLPYDSLAALRAAMYATAPALARLGAVPAAEASWTGLANAATGTPSAEPLGTAITDFYLTNPIARASGVLAELSLMKANASRRQAAE